MPDHKEILQTSDSKYPTTYLLRNRWFRDAHTLTLHVDPSPQSRPSEGDHGSLILAAQQFK